MTMYTDKDDIYNIQYALCDAMTVNYSPFAWPLNDETLIAHDKYHVHPRYASCSLLDSVNCVVPFHKVIHRVIKL